MASFGTELKVDLSADIRPDAIFAFGHIQKAGGTTWLTLLRRYWGIRHQELVTRAGQVLLRRQLEADIRFNPFIRSISGHGLWPCMDYGRCAERMVWYITLRDPIARYLSHYQHHAERWATGQHFEDWLNIGMQKNWQTKFISGGEHLDKAKEILATKMRVVGLLEHFHASCLMVREFLGWRGFRVAYGKPRNTARKGDAAKRVRDEFDRHKDRIVENNALDIELYLFASKEIFPRQVAAYGEERLKQDLEREFGEDHPSLGEKVRETGCNALRRYFYRPMILAGDILNGRRRGKAGLDDQRLIVDDKM